MAVLNDIYAVKLVSYDTSQVGINLLHHQVSAVGGAGLSDLQIANGLQTIFAPLYAILLNNNATFRGVQVQKVAPIPVNVAVNSTGAPSVGSGGATALPKQVSGLISAYTTLAGRSNRSRVYVAFPSATQNQADGIPTPGYITALNNLATALIATTTITVGANSVTLLAGVYHRRFLTITTWASIVVRGKWATQRRRGDEGRTNPVPF